MITRADSVPAVAPTAELTQVHAHRTDLVPTPQTGSITVRATDSSLLATLGARLANGSFLDAAHQQYPVAVLGSQAAGRLAVGPDHTPGRIWLTGHWFTVIGVLQPVELTPEIDRSVLIGFRAATTFFGYDAHPTRVYVRAATDRVALVASELARAGAGAFAVRRVQSLRRRQPGELLCRLWCRGRLTRSALTTISGWY